MEGLVLKSQIVCSGLKQWQIANFLGWHESKLSNVLRGCVNQDDAEKIKTAIECLRKDDNKKGVDDICKV